MKLTKQEVKEQLSNGIAAEMAESDVLEFISDNGKVSDARVSIWQLGAVRVASTNGNPIWEEQDPAAFAQLLETEGIHIT